MGNETEIALGDGRSLDIRVSGPPDGVPLVFHHGTPGGKPAIRTMERAIHARGLRLVTTSRPGYGNSTRHESRRVVDVVADTDSVLDHLDVDRCLVGGWSGGGPHAMACAARLDRAVATFVIAGIAPFDAGDLDWTDGMGQGNLAEFAAATNGPEHLRPHLEEVATYLRTTAAEDIVQQSTLLPDVDRAVMTGEFADDMVAQFGDALANGIDGWLDDDLAFVRPWGFDLDEISTPLVLWQGSDDMMVPFNHGQWFAGHLPDATVHLESGEGHLSIALGAIDRMLDELLTAAS